MMNLHTLRTAAALATLVVVAACQDDRIVGTQAETGTPESEATPGDGILDPSKGRAYTGYVLGNDGATPVKIRYQVVNGHAIYDGDIGLGPADGVAKTPEEALRQKREGRDRPSFSLHYNGSSYWGDTGGVIPVRRVFAPTNLQSALDQIESQVPGINFVDYTGQGHHLVIYYGSGSNYYNGCYSGRCEVYIGSTGASKALIMHELGHALGFQHEIKRCDRNSYIQMLDTRPDPSQFSINCNMAQMGSYDINSIMHYNSWEFGYRHFTNLSGGDVNGYWGRTTLTAGDVAAWKQLYPGGSSSTGFTATTANQGGYTGPYNLRSGPGTGYAVVGSVNGGVSVTVVCQAPGTTHTGPWGSSSIWSRLGGAHAGKYISDAFLYTGYAGYIPGVPRC